MPLLLFSASWITLLSDFWMNKKFPEKCTSVSNGWIIRKDWRGRHAMGIMKESHINIIKVVMRGDEMMSKEVALHKLPFNRVFWLSSEGSEKRGDDGTKRSVKTFYVTPPLQTFLSDANVRCIILNWFEHYLPFFDAWYLLLMMMETSE